MRKDVLSIINYLHQPKLEHIKKEKKKDRKKKRKSQQNTRYSNHGVLM